MRMLILVALVAVPLWPQALEMPLRTHSANGQARIEVKRLATAHAAIIICDMWDQHWCSGATRRVALLAARMEPFLKTARAAGVLIVHAPSETIDFYKDYPQRAAMPAPVCAIMEQVAAEDKPDYREVREVLRTKAQSDLIDFFNTELDLAFSTLQTAHLEQGDDQERYQTTIGDVD